MPVLFSVGLGACGLLLRESFQRDRMRRRLASGNLLLVNHYKFTGRSHLTAHISIDDGKTWNDGLLLDPGTATAPESPQALVSREPSANSQIVMIPQPGVYQVDVHLADADAIFVGNGLRGLVRVRLSPDD